MVGYYSLDPFAPVSAIALWVIAGAIYRFGKKRERNHDRALTSLASEVWSESNDHKKEGSSNSLTFIFEDMAVMS
jgi:hypothetical protein